MHNDRENHQIELSLSTEPSSSIPNIDIRTLPIPVGIASLHLFEIDRDIKQHAAYFQAKAGDVKAAVELVSDLALAQIFASRERFPQDCIFVAPHAKEASGDNAIPQVLAEVSAIVCGAMSDKDIVQSTKVYHTGADPMERLISRPEFEGAVQPGKRYVLVDDVTSLGGTLAELAHYIQKHGGLVQDVFVLVNAGRKKSLLPDKMTLRKLETRYANELIEIFGIAVSALTANEAQYLVGFRSADEIRNRVVKAKQEIYLRLCAKGVPGFTTAQT
jgi:hypothetical protein